MNRAFSRRDLLRGAARRSLLWSLCAALALAALLISLLLIAFLIQSGGRMTVSARDLDSFRELTGLETAGGTFPDAGLAEAVWSSRNLVWGELLATAYRELPVLQSNIPALAALLAAAFVCLLLFGCFHSLSHAAAVRAGLETAGRLRRNIHRQALRVGPGDLLESDQRRVANLFSTESDVVQSAVASRVFTLGIGTLALAALIGLALTADWRVCLQSLIPLLCGWYLFTRLEGRSTEAGRRDDASRREGLGELSESFAKSRIIRGCGMETFEHQQFQNDLDAFHRRIAADVGKRERRRWLMWLFAGAGTAVVVLFAGIKALRPIDDAAALSPATALFLIGIFGLLWFPLKRLSLLSPVWAAAVPAAERIYQYLDRIPDVSQAVGAKFLQPLSSSIQFQSVHYDVPGRGPLLKGLDLKLGARMTHALVSLNPLEARALAYLLPRFIEPKSGHVLIDGEDLQWVTLESLRAETTYVGGTDPWFTGTVLENIRCGDERRTLQDVTDAAKTVHAHKFISDLPRGYETKLGHNGLRLNAGQSFRLALARAIIQNPALMIIEEPAGPLDADTKSLLDDAYNRIIPGRTMIFLPSRLSTVRRVDSVVVVNNGRVEAIGRHTDLVKTNAAYRHWEYTHFNEFRNGRGLP